MNLPFFLLSHFLLLLIPLLLVLSNPSPAPDPYPAVISLPARQAPSPHAARPSLASAIHPAPPEVEHDLLPFVLISTIDGALHAVDREGGTIRWSLKEGVDPLIGGGAVGNGSEEDYIVEPLSGSLYVFEEGEDIEDDSPRVRKLPLTVDKLIELSPFTFPHSPSRIFTGSKSSSLLTIDLRTGQQLDCFSSLSYNSSDYSQCVCANENLLDDLERRTRSNRDVLFVGRTDYRLTIHTPPGTGVSGVTIGDRPKSGGGVQEIMYSTYTPNSFDRPLAEFWAKMGKEELYEEDGTLAKRLRVELGHDGVAVGVEQGGGVKWVTKLGNVGIAVYDILHPLSPASANPILVPQPPAQSSALFPLPAQPRSSHLDILSKRPSTYIGTLPNLPSLLPPPTSQPVSDQPQSARRPLHYALSSSSYPLILFAPPPRPGSLTNGSFILSEDLPERDQLLPYLLDPPLEEKGIPPPEEERVDIRPDQDVKEGSGWLIWLISSLGGLAMCGAGAAVWSSRSKSKVAVSPSAEEKTPLLIAKDEKDRSVTFEEPVLERPIESADTAPLIPNDNAALADSVDLNETPKKKSTRRRVRGKKKPKNGIVGKEEDGEDDQDEEGGSKGEKPLPDLPREMSVVDIRDEDDKEKLTISDCIIGYGSHGTVVLKGTWGSRPVAVKRLLSDFTRLASQEVKLLQASDDHPNVIRYYCQEKRDNFLYIALDLCQASLADLMESPDRYREMASGLDRKRAMREITRGVEHLHGMKIIHRDIKPQNVLVSQLKDGSLRMLVSDFGLARRLEHDQSSFAPTANNLAGSLGWRAPECIRGQVKLTEPFDRSSSGERENGTMSSSTSSSSSLSDMLDRNPRHRLTKAVDLFALGCLYFWILMSGQHPFGEVYDRESNIVKGDIVNMGLLDILGEEGVEAGELIGRMLSTDPGERPQTSECVTHPFFWTPAKRLAFLCDASDRFEIMELDPPEPPVVQLEAAALEVVGKDWFSRADKVFTSNLGKYRKYKGNSVRDLLRAMRNKKHHYQDLEPSAKRHFGTLPAGFLHYFTSRYPRLFLHVYGVVKESRLRHESMFEGYFQAGD